MTNSNLNNSYTSKKMPIFFLGHGSPLNAIEDNDFTQSLNKIGQSLHEPRGILMISAHWETKDTLVTGMSHPKTIHDFHGFPNTLFEVEYPVPGLPSLAQEIANTIHKPEIIIDTDQWGLDHGTWSVLKHMFPQSNIPVIQLSLDMNQPLNFHFEMGKKLSFLREKGIIIMGSGNIVHNLQHINWSQDSKPHDWAVEFDEWVKDKLIQRKFDPLIDSPTASQSGKLSVPTLEHYLPLLYVIGASNTSDKLTFTYEGFQHSSLSMRCFSFS